MMDFAVLEGHECVEFILLIIKLLGQLRWFGTRAYSRMLNVSRAAIYSACIRQEIYGTGVRLPHPRRAWATRARKDRLLALWPVREWWINARTLKTEMVEATSATVGSQTNRNPRFFWIQFIAMLEPGKVQTRDFGLHGPRKSGFWRWRNRD